MQDIRNLEQQTEEVVTENTLRPKFLSDFAGQSGIKENLKIFIDAAKKREESIDHILFCGPPGLGKTTLANIIAHEMNVNIKTTSGPMITKTGDLAAILTNLSSGDILFIDEIHRLPVAVEETLYTAMEDYRLDIIIGSGPAARTVKINLNRFTLIGATTRLGLLSNPLRDRFGIILQLAFYNETELAHVVDRCIQKFSLHITHDAKLTIAKRSRGTPRIAIRLTRRVADIASILFPNKQIDDHIANTALDRLGIDSFGLDDTDIRYLRFILSHYSGGPVGLDTIAAGISEDKNTVEEVIEPFLLQQGLLERTNKGRVLTRNCIDHLMSHK